MTNHSVIGRITGDNECWCMEVTESEYRRINGDEYADLDMEVWKEMHTELDMEVPPKIWRIYPSDLIEKRHQGTLVKLEIIVKGISE